MDLVARVCAPDQKGPQLLGTVPLPHQKRPPPFPSPRTSRSSSASAAGRAAGPSTSSWSWKTCPSGTRCECWPSGWTWRCRTSGGSAPARRSGGSGCWTINKAAARCSTSGSTAPEGAAGLAYLQRRGLSPRTADPLRPGLRPRRLGRPDHGPGGARAMTRRDLLDARAGGEQQGRPASTTASATGSCSPSSTSGGT